MAITIGGLLLIGLFLLIAEFYLFPGTTLIGIAGLLVLVAAVVITFNKFGLATGFLTLLITALVGGALLYQGYKTFSSSGMALTKELDGKVNELENVHFTPGTEGFAYTDLRPVGKAFINGNKYEVHSLSNFIKKDTPIVVHKIEVNKIIVKSLNKS